MVRKQYFKGRNSAIKKKKFDIKKQYVFNEAALNLVHTRDGQPLIRANLDLDFFGFLDVLSRVK